jgi:pimeloyl-ACP methyl ester carboxylesterase
VSISSVASDDFLDRPGGRLAYSLRGEGPLVVAVPGMGDLRSSYDGLAEAFAAAGFRVAAMDVRGHGDSDTSFEKVGDEATADDIVALIERLGGPALVVGTSFGGSAAVLAAADRPQLVTGLVLLSPFLRAPSGGGGRFAHLLYRLLFARPWGAAVWAGYYRRVLNRGTTPNGLARHVAAIRSSLRRPGRLAALRRLALELDHSVVEPRTDAVRAPTLIVVGALDPDYPDPAAELRWMSERVGAESLLVEDAAHYPHLQRPELVHRAVLDFALSLPDPSATPPHA